VDQRRFALATVRAYTAGLGARAGAMATDGLARLREPERRAAVADRLRDVRREPRQELTRAALAVRGTWRRSLQLRVVALTLALSAVLVAAFGWLVASQITAGLLHAKQNDTGEQVREGGKYAISQLQISDAHDPALVQRVPLVLAHLAGGEQPGRAFEVIIVPASAMTELHTQALPDRDAYRVVEQPGLAQLRGLVRGGQMVRQAVTANPDGASVRPYLAYGTLIRTDGGNLELYYLFPLDNEVNAANLVRTTVVVTGVTLVALLAAVAGLVTRLVVRPVRVAARTAQRLSAGLLDQRMQVRGEDDLARLAASFNQMAGNLQRQITRLEEMSRLQRRFTSDVSHELRTPLTTVRMAADLMFSARDEFDPAVARSAEILQAELDRFEALLTDLLEISRFDAGFAVLDAEPTDLASVVRRVADRLLTVAERSGTELQLDTPDEPVVAEVDPRRVERILRNLVGNAVEHGEGRPVRIALRADESAVAVTVRDYGVGLRPGEEDLVFSRFWRADPSRARQTGGTGLGLSISLEDARLHGGWLQVWGQSGQGAQFRLTLPVHAGERLTSSPLNLVPDEVVPPTGNGFRAVGQPVGVDGGGHG
jgi:two-component system sensor histidine kinase MtrB